LPLIEDSDECLQLKKLSEEFIKKINESEDVNGIKQSNAIIKEYIEEINSYIKSRCQQKPT
jgi:hypothetical protein